MAGINLPVNPTHSSSALHTHIICIHDNIIGVPWQLQGESSDVGLKAEGYGEDDEPDDDEDAEGEGAAADMGSGSGSGSGQDRKLRKLEANNRKLARERKKMTSGSKKELRRLQKVLQDPTIAAFPSGEVLMITEY